MPWIGVSENVSAEEFEELLRELGLAVKRRLKEMAELKTSRGWIKFRIYEVEGEVEGAASSLARAVNAPVFESGPHLVLGETSAKLWDEGAKVAFPDGHEELVAIFTYDGFLDVRMPTKNVRGLKATMVVGGKTYVLPLDLNDLIEIYSMGEKALEKVEKAASVYGIERVISRSALEALKKRREKAKVEVDYEAGLVLVVERGRMKAVSLERFFLELVYKGDQETIKSIFEKAPENVKEKLASLLKEELKINEEIKAEDRIRSIKRAAENLGILEQITGG